MDFIYLAFHAKGVWCVQDGLPSLTIIGSSNFGHRSVHRDLEFQLAIFSKNKPLQQLLLKVFLTIMKGINLKMKF